jgi:hypothetical protein
MPRPDGHPVDRAGQDLLHAAQAVAMHHRALEKVGDGRQADVRMRPHVVFGARLFGGRPEMVEEHERPDRAALRRRQQAPHVEAAAQVLVVRRSSWVWGVVSSVIVGFLRGRRVAFLLGCARSCHLGDALAKCTRGLEVAFQHFGRRWRRRATASAGRP